MGLSEAVESVLIKNYSNFSGRARRSEYWYWILFSMIVGIILSFAPIFIGPILDGILATHSGQDAKKVRKDTERDHYLTGEEALKYGLIDKLITKREEAEKKKK